MQCILWLGPRLYDVTCPLDHVGRKANDKRNTRISFHVMMIIITSIATKARARLRGKAVGSHTTDILSLFIDSGSNVATEILPSSALAKLSRKLY